MKIYLVGGAVRDALLGLPVKEKDYVVVGATVDDMLKLRFRQVGKDFPVFLHPDTHEEYALARMERKVSPGYTGFTFDASPDVTLEEDLLRRDLTINAMAMSLDSDQLIDPFHGKDDLDKKILRHVSLAFIEDPVRILRVARFAARFASLGFTVAADTNELMQRMVQAHEVDALVPERVWKELERALAESHPEVFFEVLRDCDALPILFPEIQTENCIALRESIPVTEDPEIRFAVLLSNLSRDEIRELTDRLRVPGNYKELALMVSKYLSTCRRARELSAEQMLDLLQSVDAFRREARFMKFLTACEALSPDHAGTQKLIPVLSALKKIDIKPLLTKKMSGEELARKIREMRIDVITQLR